MPAWEVAIMNIYDLDDIPRELEGGWQPIGFVGFHNQEARILVRRHAQAAAESADEAPADDGG